jgi:RimJ/RimL family protein N-acetyltransferase/protein tyrosine phosphatase (PTP) superfamily phosphohydrolase (DUF442 family)
MSTVVLETARLRLRHVDLQDAAFVRELVNEPAWLRFIGDRGVHSLDDARTFIENGPRKMYAQHGFGLFAVELKADAVPMGLCGLIRRDTLPDVDIGFAFLLRFRGQGYAREAAAATLQYAREVQQLDRVVAITKPDNVPSGKLLERIGLRLEGVVRLQGSNEELSYYGTSPTFAEGPDAPPFDAENVRQVFGGLWTSGQLSAADIARLPALGVEAVVNLALPTSSNALPGEAELVTDRGIAYVQIPVPWEQPQQAQFEQFCGVLEAFKGRKVWVHCARNMRVSAFIYLYRRLRRGEPQDTAAQTMNSIWTPDPTWQAFIDEALSRRAVP